MSFVIVSMMVSAFATCGATPDFDYIFNRLDANRRIYNDYNDLVKRPMESELWMSLFLERSDIVTAMYKENEYLINCVKEAFAGDSVPDGRYDLLADCLFMMEDRGTGDPFMAEEFMKLILPHYLAGADGDAERRARLYYYFASTQYEIAVLGCEQAKAAANEYYRRTIAMSNSLPAHRQKPVIKALTDMLTAAWTPQGCNSAGEVRGYFECLQKLIRRKDVVAGLDAATMSQARKAVAGFDRRLIQEGYMNDPEMLDPALADSLIDAQIAEYESMDYPDLKSFCAKNQLELYKDYISVDSALRATLDFYKSKDPIPASVAPEDMNRLPLPLLTLIDFNDRSTIPYADKCENARFLCCEVVRLFSLLDDNQTDNGFVSVMARFATCKPLLRYLDLSQKLHFIARLMVNTQVATMAHSAHVAALSVRIADAVEKYRPDLMPRGAEPGPGGWHEFMRRAALYHDIGKLSIASVVTNEFRPLTDHERKVIRRHPALGVELLAMDRDLARFHDTTLGHHRYFDGKDGYPAEFDNTASPVKIITDILTVADCLDAATDMIGRNYSPVKHFGATIDEMNRQAGTRYNPDVLGLIINTPELYHELEAIVDNEWMNIYYRIYETYFDSENAPGMDEMLAGQASAERDLL